MNFLWVGRQAINLDQVTRILDRTGEEPGAESRIELVYGSGMTSLLEGAAAEAVMGWLSGVSLSLPLVPPAAEGDYLVDRGVGPLLPQAVEREEGG